jgi:hypothetical protein
LLLLEPGSKLDRGAFSSRPDGDRLLQTDDVVLSERFLVVGVWRCKEAVTDLGNTLIRLTLEHFHREHGHLGRVHFFLLLACVKEALFLLDAQAEELPATALSGSELLRGLTLLKQKGQGRGLQRE